METVTLKVWEKEIQGEIIIQQKGAHNDTQVALFHKDGTRRNDVDILYYNPSDQCWKSECESMGRGYEYHSVLELVNDGYDDIVDELLEHNYRLVSCYSND